MIDATGIGGQRLWYFHMLSRSRRNVDRIQLRDLCGLFAVAPIRIKRPGIVVDHDRLQFPRRLLFDRKPIVFEIC